MNLVGSRVLAVHAHPDDEALWTGGALAALAQRGADVHVVTCTLGEEGEVIGEPYQHLVDADQLGGFRIAELWASLDILGVHGHHLGAPGKYRDSGMAGSETGEQAFVNRTAEAVADLLAIMEKVQPDCILTYGPDGGYGHPDHIQAHRIAHEAVQQYDPSLRIWWAVTDRASQEAGLAAITEIPHGWRRAEPGELANVEQVDLKINLDDQAYAAKASAMAAHATQLWIADGRVSRVNPHAAWAKSDTLVFALSNLIAQPLTKDECYQLGNGQAPHYTGEVENLL